jgi:asparagine synthase (glutamine-hydrolysing)
MVSEPSSVFLHHALAMAKEAGLRVVITGEANDEISCGHGEMIRIRDGYYRKWEPFMRLPRGLRRVAAIVGSRLSPQRRDILRRAASGEEYFWNFETAWMDSEKSEIMSPSAMALVRNGEPAGAVAARWAERVRGSEHGRRDQLNLIIYLMMQDYYFGNLMLGKLDLLAGRLGIEARCPYASAEYAHFVYNIPAPLKSRDGMVKYFFKKSIEGLLPDEIIYRPKQGFRTPVVELFQGRLGDWARPALLDSGLTREGFLRRETIERLLGEHRAGVRDHSNRLWTVLVLNLWHARWVDSTRSVGHVPGPVTAVA